MLVSPLFYRYTFKIKGVQKHSFHTKTVLIVAQPYHDLYLWGECSIDLGVISQDLLAIQIRYLLRQYIPGVETLFNTLKNMHETACNNFICTSVLFCCECIIIQKYFHDQDMGQCVPFQIKQHIPLNALLNHRLAQTPDYKHNYIMDDMRDEIIHLLQLGYTCFKIKVDCNLDINIAKIKYLRRLIGPYKKIRLDANRQLSYDEMLYMWKYIKECNIEYIEEPLQNTSQLLLLYEQTHLPFALDESMCQPTIKELSHLIEHAKAIVLKPSIVGLYQSLLYYLQYRNRKIAIVPSSNFETEISIYTILLLLGQSHVNAGFDVIRWYQNSILEIPFTIKTGYIFVAYNHMVNNIRTSQLDRIYI